MQTGGVDRLIAPIPMTASDLPIELPIELPVCDTSRRFVRVISQRADGLVAFEFSIGWPELAVELLLPSEAFDEFCVVNRVQRLDPSLPASTTTGDLE